MGSLRGVKEVEVRRACGYFLMAIILPLSWLIQLGLPIYGIYYIVKTFIDDGVIAGLISIPVTMIAITFLEFGLGFVMMFPSTLVAFLLDQERPTKPQRTWFQRHLNWTMVFIWVLIHPVALIIGDMLGISLDLLYLMVPIIVILPLSGWTLKQKKRSLWWLLLFIIPFMWLVFLGLENRSIKEQGAWELAQIGNQEAEVHSAEFETEMAHIRHQLKKAYMVQGMTAEEADKKIKGDEQAFRETP